MSDDAVRGVFSDDPLANIVEGLPLDVSRLAFPPQMFGPATTWDVFRGVLVKLLFGDGVTLRVMGSGVMVAPGVALAAKHVIEPELPEIHQKRSKFFVTAVNGDHLDIWRVDHVVFLQDESDLALLILNRASKLEDPARISQVKLTTRVPRIGEVVAICGFVAGRVEDANVIGDVHVCRGLVTEHYIHGRDRCMLPGPCFAIGVGTEGGLSGGPVFDETGRLVGILSTSLGAETHDISFASMIFPMLVQKFTPRWPKGLVTVQTSLQEHPCCLIDGADKLRAEGNSHIYTPWS